MPKRTTYQEWYSRQTAANGQGSVEVERKKAYNIKADQEQFDAFLGVLPAVSYTHLDVYKRQFKDNPEGNAPVTVVINYDYGGED